MSKAFTRESDESDDLPLTRRPSSLLPPGTPNHITPQGLRKVRDELAQWLQEDRPALAKGLPDPEVKARLQRLDQRAGDWQRIVESAVVIQPPDPPHDRVLFGAEVTIRNPQGELTSYRIVGVDEADVDQGQISWLSPLAKALTGALVGQSVKVRFPSGEEELRIISVSYPND